MFTIVATAIVYFAVLFIIKALSEDEIILLPKGDVILSKLKKFKIM